MIPCQQAPARSSGGRYLRLPIGSRLRAAAAVSIPIFRSAPKDKDNGQADHSSENHGGASGWVSEESEPTAKKPKERCKAAGKPLPALPESTFTLERILLLGHRFHFHCPLMRGSIFGHLYQSLGEGCINVAKGL